MLWLRAWRVKGNPERLLEIVGKNLVHLWLPVVIRIAHDAHAVRLALADENVAIRRGNDHPRRSQIRSKLVHREALWNFRQGALRTLHNLRLVLRGGRRVGLRKFVDRDAPTHPWRVGLPIVERRLSC